MILEEINVRIELFKLIDDGRKTYPVKVKGKVQEEYKNDDQFDIFKNKYKIATNANSELQKS